uniref:Uncharacterized protein n=1 Tax=Arundo donax TaxID=35708 RepID=A0A0A9EEM8_ARUDO
MEENWRRSKRFRQKKMFLAEIYLISVTSIKYYCMVVQARVEAGQKREETLQA